MELLSDIVTIGFPRIPRSTEAYQTCHKGEINSIIGQDYDGQELFIFSAKTSSGNSGSPVINRYGLVVGIVTQELFEQQSFKEQGKLPYYAAIPAKYISQFICFEINKPAVN
jgi:S1-C subfamily serine protease